ncbi:conserved hypothetical protein [Ricinus communis]|uniref:Transcription factor n=1 Tax=Ricinus communis TaxID=3988 RepID=B9SJE1_RICCO|nr:conserved hypothetical protein [Ricinus communis]
MSSVSKNSKISMKQKKKTPRKRTSILERRRRRLIHVRRRLCKKAQRSSTCSSSKVSHKLEALKNLIPANNGEIVKADQLFQETADYIVLLRTQVFVLQRLIQFYGSSTTEADNENAVIL